ncbi:MAG: hypothetical protein FJY10_01135 [Bacteroidetes bacterium]|nr:hypothetical protein [Bacteroidota bacterium]
MKILNRDSFLFGILIALILPALSFGVLFGLNSLIRQLFNFETFLTVFRLLLLSLVLNLLLLRYYLVARKFEKSGKGVLLITFALTLIFFIYHFLK